MDLIQKGRVIWLILFYLFFLGKFFVKEWVENRGSKELYRLRWEMVVEDGYKFIGSKEIKYNVNQYLLFLKKYVFMLFFLLGERIYVLFVI